jgi:hypothetical protein
MFLAVGISTSIYNEINPILIADCRQEPLTKALGISKLSLPSFRWHDSFASYFKHPSVTFMRHNKHFRLPSRIKPFSSPLLQPFLLDSQKPYLIPFFTFIIQNDKGAAAPTKPSSDGFQGQSPVKTRKE